MWNRNEAIISELASHGHNITVLSPFSEEDPPSNVHYIAFDDEFNTVLIDIVKKVLNGTENINPFYEQLLWIHSYESMCSGEYKLQSNH